MISPSTTKALVQAGSEGDHFPDKKVELRCPRKVKVVFSKKDSLSFGAWDSLM